MRGWAALRTNVGCHSPSSSPTRRARQQAGVFTGDTCMLSVAHNCGALTHFEGKRCRFGYTRSDSPGALIRRAHARPRTIAADSRQQADDGGKSEGDVQLQPRQVQQIEQIGEPDRAGLGGQHQNADKGQPPEVLASGGQQLYGGEHELS
uniref:Uncharacterized protein n=1 Tax=Tanacetum cinerariifolium TaxID=118510 RepID=A0A699RC09_TANCI|nr:hypothetical protein [Tanacetum cinerariifolium]